MAKTPNINSAGEKELARIGEQFDEFKGQVETMTLDRMNMAPKNEQEPQTRLSQNQIANSKDIYLKPKRTIGSKEKFNENYRDQYNHDKEYVRFIAENKEIIGESIEMWTKPYAGLPCEFWEIPTNKPVWAPRYVAEQIKRCFYHRLTMTQTTTGMDDKGSYYGSMAVDSTVPRLDARPVSNSTSIFMGSKTF